MADERDPLAFADVEGDVFQRFNFGKTLAEAAEAATRGRLEHGFLEGALVRVEYGEGHADIVCPDIHLL